MDCFSDPVTVIGRSVLTEPTFARADRSAEISRGPANSILPTLAAIATFKAAGASSAYSARRSPTLLILSAAGSKYCPVAANAVIAEILDSRDRLAVVGLPCHIQGLRKAERRIPKLAEQIRYRISLACSLNFSFRGTERFLENLGLAPESVEVFQYRGRGWPGSVLIRLTDGTKWVVPYAQCYRKLGPYSLRRCTLCSDMLGELSDLTCGDGWVPQIVRTDKAGSSFVVSRTPEAEELLESAASNGAVELSELALGDLLASQGHALFKKRKLKARMQLFKLARQSVPVYRQKLLTPIRADYISTMKLYTARYMLAGHHRLLRRLFQLIRRRKRRSVKAGAQLVEVMTQP